MIGDRLRLAAHVDTWRRRIRRPLWVRSGRATRAVSDIGHPTENSNWPDRTDINTLKSLALGRPYRSAQVMSFGERAAKQRTAGREWGREVNRPAAGMPQFWGVSSRDHRDGESSDRCCWRRERHPAPTFSLFLNESANPTHPSVSTGYALRDSKCPASFVSRGDQTGLAVDQHPLGEDARRGRCPERRSRAPPRGVHGGRPAGGADTGRGRAP